MEPHFTSNAPETAAAAGEHHDRLRHGAWGALAALLMQYGPEVAAVYQAHVAALEAEVTQIEREFEGDNEPEGLAPAA